MGIENHPLPKLKSIDQFLKGDSDKVEAFINWCKKEGVVYPKLEYPAYFEGGLVGMRVKEDIEHREGFISVPYKMWITVGKAQAHPVLGDIIK